MRDLQICADTLPDIEKEHLDGTFLQPTRQSTKEHEKSSPYVRKIVFDSAAKFSCQVNPYAAKVLEDLGLRLVEDDFIKWRTDASAHPRNWTAARKTFDTGIVILLDLFTWVINIRYFGPILISVRTAVSTAGVRPIHIHMSHY